MNTKTSKRDGFSSLTLAILFGVFLLLHVLTMSFLIMRNTGNTEAIVFLVIGSLSSFVFAYLIHKEMNQDHNSETK